MARIAVIGAGVTGSLLAHKLSKDGHTVTVLEKSRGRGGRCTTKRTQWGQFDVGAPIIRTHHQQIIGLLDELEAAGVARRWHVSVADYYHQHSTIPNLQVQSTDDRFYVFTPGMNAACRYWLQGCTLITSARIAHLQKTPAGWLLWDQQQGKYGAFDWVVVTVPWPQAQPLLAEHCNDLPPQAVSQWLACKAVAMQFAQPIRDQPALIYLHNSALQLLVCDSAKPGRPLQSGQIWVAHFSHSPSDWHQNSDDKCWSEFACAQMAAVFGQVSLKPEHSYQHYWRYARLSHEGTLPGMLSDAALKLAAAGDWSFGGAIPSAIKAACGLHSQLTQIL